MHTLIQVCKHAYAHSRTANTAVASLLLSAIIGPVFLIMNVLKYLCMDMLQILLSQLLIGMLSSIAVSILFHVRIVGWGDIKG